MRDPHRRLLADAKCAEHVDQALRIERDDDDAVEGAVGTAQPFRHRDDRRSRIAREHRFADVDRVVAAGPRGGEVRTVGDRRRVHARLRVRAAHEAARGVEDVDAALGVHAVQRFHDLDQVGERGAGDLALVEQLRERQRPVGRVEHVHHVLAHELREVVRLRAPGLERRLAVAVHLVPLDPHQADREQHPQRHVGRQDSGDTTALGAVHGP